MGLEDFRNQLSDSPQSLLSDATSAAFGSLLKNLSDVNQSPAGKATSVPIQVNSAVSAGGPVALGASGNVSPTASITKEDQPDGRSMWDKYKLYVYIAGGLALAYVAYKKLKLA